VLSVFSHSIPDAGSSLSRTVPVATQPALVISQDLWADAARSAGDAALLAYAALGRTVKPMDPRIEWIAAQQQAIADAATLELWGALCFVTGACILLALTMWWYDPY
jgi:hypothetical protein